MTTGTISLLSHLSETASEIVRWISTMSIARASCYIMATGIVSLLSQHDNMTSGVVLYLLNLTVSFSFFSQVDQRRPSSGY